MNSSLGKNQSGVYSHLYKLSIFFVVIVAFLLFSLLFYFFSEYVIRDKIRDLGEKISSLYRLSDKIEENVAATSFMLKEIYTDPRYLANDLKGSIDFFKKLGMMNKYFYGVGYALNPKYKNYGVYVYRNSSGNMIVDNMEKIYKKHGQEYYKRPWFKRVMNERKSIYFSPQVNWFGAPSYNITYAFPLFYKKNIYAIGVVDVSMSEFFDLLLQESKNDEDVDTYYISKTYDHHKNKIISLDGNFIPKEGLESLTKEVPVHNNSYSEGKGWTYKGGYLYRHIDFMKGALSFIVKINLFPTFFKITFLFLVIISIVLFIARFLLKMLKKEITNISLPIEYIVEEVNKIAAGDLSHNISIKSGIYEVDRLTESIESMRNELINLIEKEKESEHIKTEIQLASRIQSAFLSQSDKEIEKIKGSIEVYCSYDKGNMISGDVYFVNRVNNSIYIFIGDSSGKDIAASIFSLFVLARFKVLSHQSMGPAKLLTELNNYLCEFNNETMFITAICCKINVTTMECTIANAGHDQPFLYSGISQEVKGISSEANLVLGILANQDYNEINFQLGKNEEIILYTDGVTEAVRDNKTYGKVRIAKFIKHCNRSLVADMAADLVADVAKFNYDNTNRDDRTVVWIRNKQS